MIKTIKTETTKEYDEVGNLIRETIIESTEYDDNIHSGNAATWQSYPTGQVSQWEPDKWWTDFYHSTVTASNSDGKTSECTCKKGAGR